MKKLIQFQMSFDNVEVREDKLVIIGYASTPSVDSYSTVVPVEVVKNGLENYKKNPIVLLSHDATKPIGTVSDWEVDEGGWRVTAEIINNTDGVMDDIRNGITKGFSIGFIPEGWVYIDTRNGNEIANMTDKEKDEVPYEKIGRRFTGIDIRELSVVTTPSNPDSIFNMKRALNKFFGEMEIRMVASDKRIMLSDQENPFVEDKEDEPTQEDEQIPTEQQDTVVEEEAPQGQEHEVMEEETQNDTDENSDIEASNVEEKDGNEGEAPDAPQGEGQTETNELQDELDQERKLNSDLLETMEKMMSKVEELQARINKIPVNKPKMYSRNTEVDPLLNSMIQAKRGN